MVLVKLLKTNLLSELGKEKAFIRLRKSLCYWVQISIQCYPFGNSRFKKKNPSWNRKGKQKTIPKLQWIYPLYEVKGNQINELHAFIKLSFKMYLWIEYCNFYQALTVPTEINLVHFIDHWSFYSSTWKISLNTGSKKTGNQTSSLFGVLKCF